MSTPPAPPAPRSESTPAPDCAPQLKQMFPALFSGAPKPLKLRIQNDIQERAPGTFSKQSLSAFFRRYTSSTSYLIAVSKAKQRFDLDGQPAGELSDEHREIAMKELTRRRELRESRQALEDQQRRNRAGLLRDFENTTLTAANFCALKGVAVEELDGLLALARQELQEDRERGRGAPPQQRDRPQRPPQGDRPSRPPRPERQARPR